MNAVESAKYVASYPKISKCPITKIPEYAFIGRSNVGKSSLINMLTGRRELAKVSKKPGKTQMINYFLIDQKWHLVDLPGYGYAVASKKTRAKWGKMIENYLSKREILQCAFVLLDSNIPAQKIDIEFLNWMGEQRIPFVIVYTKIDRARRIGEAEENIKKIQAELLEYWEELPQQFITSSNKATGREEILSFIGDINEKFHKPF